MVMSRGRGRWGAFVAAALGCALPGCMVPSDRLTFPAAPLRADETGWLYDVDNNGVVDFAARAGDDGRITALAYDDDEDGVFDRVYRLADVDDERVPHLILLLDSLPYEAAAAAHAAGALPAFAAPRKVIAPFPSMSELIFSTLLGVPPPPGMINRYYDRRTGGIENRIVKRAFGARNPWQLRLHYHIAYWENGLTFLKPRPWYGAEMRRVKDALDESPDRITVVYVASTAGLVSKYGAEAFEEVFTEIHRLVMQLLYERCGALQVSVVSDHGHNLVPAKRVSLDHTLRAAGFRVTNRLRGDRDVVYDIDGLVNYLGINTRRAAEVADTLLPAHPELELAMYLDGTRVVVRDRSGAAVIERRGERLRYAIDTADVLGYTPVLEALRAAGKVDEAGWVGDRDWFEATVDHYWPDAPRRLWDAFHGNAVNTPELMLTFRDGYCTGLDSLAIFVTMRSTHGGLHQADSAAFAMSMTDRLYGPMRTRDVLAVLEPAYDSGHKPGGSR